MNHDVVIIGNGVLGLSTAYVLAKENPTLRIVVIGSESTLGCASLASGAMLNAFAELTNKSLTSKAGKAKFEMALKASKMWPKWLEEINEELEAKKRLRVIQGTHIILNAQSGRLDTNNYLSIIQALNDYKEPYEINKDPCSIPGMCPHSTYRPLHGIYIPSEGALDSHAHIQALKTVLSKKKNVELRSGEVVKIDVKSHKVKGVHLKSGAVLQAEKVLLANGAKSQELIDSLKELASKMPRLLYGVGYSASLSQLPDNPVKQIIRTPNRAGACGLHVLPKGGKLYVGATNMVYNDPEDKLRAGLSMFLLECVITQINGSLYGARIEDWYMGYRPATLDTFPLIGKTSIDGLWILTGTYRDGFHQSPLLATHMARLLMGKKGLFDEHLFAPERKLISTMTKEEAIAEFIEHYIACMAEHGENTPIFMRSKSFKQILETQFFERLYSELDTHIGFAPDILFMFALDDNPKKLISSFKKYFLEGKTPAHKR